MASKWFTKPRQLAPAEHPKPLISRHNLCDGTHIALLFYRIAVENLGVETMNWKHKASVAALLLLSLTASAASLSVDPKLTERLANWMSFNLPNFPEPFSVGLLGLGLIGIGICRTAQRESEAIEAKETEQL